MDAPTSTGIPTQPAPLKPWKQVAEESNIFSLPPEQRLAEYDKWSSQVVEQGIKNGDFDSPDTFSQFKLKDIRTRKNLASDDIIGPSDDDIATEYDSFTKSFQDTQRAFAADKPTPQDEAIQGEVLQGKRKSAFLRGQMFFNPAVVNDPQKYREAILESDAPSDIKMFYAGLRPEMEKSATVTRRRELANNVITRDVADKVVTAIQEGTELFGADIGTPQSPALKKNKDGIWSVVDPEYSDKETSFLGRANAKYNPLADSQYKPLTAINEYQKKYGLTDEQVQQDYMESLIENAPTSVNRWLGKATSIEDYVKQLDSTVRVKNKDVAPEVRVQDPNLFFDAEGYNAAVDKAKAPDEAKTFAKEARTQFADAVAGDIYNNLLNNRDDFRDNYAKNVVDRKGMEKAITRYYKDKKDQAWYDDVGETIGQAGTALTQGGMNLMMMPSAIKGMFGDVEAAEDYRYYTLAQKGEMQAEEAVANRTGGAGFIKLNNDVMRIIPDLVVQMGIAVATGGTLSGAQASLIAARTGISRAAATTALRQAAITGEKTALKSQLLKLIPEVTTKTVDDVAEEVLKASARTASNNPFKGGIGTQRAVGSAYAGLTSASSTFGQVYTDVRNMGKSPEESIATARTAGIVAGAITSGLTHSFGMLGRGGVEDFASMGRKAGEFTIKDIVNAGLADSLSTPEGRQLIRNIAKSFGRDALSEGAEEGLDQALNLISQYATNPSPEAQNRKATDIINESLYATLLGGIAGGGAFTAGQARATAPGVTAQQMQQEVLGAQEPVAPNVAPPVPVAPNVAPTIQPSADPVVQEAKDTVESLAEIPDTSQTAAALAALANAAAIPKPEFDLPEIETVKPAPEPEVQPAEEPVVQPESATPEVAPVNTEETLIEPTPEPAKVEPEPTENMKTARDTTKPEQMTPEEAVKQEFDSRWSGKKVEEYSAWLEKNPKPNRVLKEEGVTKAQQSERFAKWIKKQTRTLWFNVAKQRAIPNSWVIDTPTKEFMLASKYMKQGNIWVAGPNSKPVKPDNWDKQDYEAALEAVEEDRASAQSSSEAFNTYLQSIEKAISENRPVSVAAMEYAQYKAIPEGYVKQGELYVYQPEQKVEAVVEDVANEAPEEAMARGDRFKDSSGQEYEVWKNRQGTIEAHPVVDGKPVVNRESTVRFSVSNAAKARNPEDRTDIATSSVVSKADVDAATEATVAETQAKPRPDVAAVRAKIKEAGSTYDKVKLIEGMISSGEFIPAVIEAAETGDPLDKIPASVFVSREQNFTKTVGIDRISAPKIKVTTPEKSAEVAISKDETRFILNGVFLDAESQKVVATDGKLLIAIPAKVDGESRVVFNRNIKESKNNKAVKKGDVIIGSYPNWKGVVPEPKSKKKPVNTDEALRATTVLLGAKKPFNRDDSLVAVVEIEKGYFNPEYIKNAITGILQSGAKSIVSQMDSDTSPLLLTGDNGAFAVVMPLRVPEKGNIVLYKLGKQPQPTKQDAVQEPSPDISIAEPISSSETPEPGDEVGWTTGRGDKATSVVGQIRFGNAQVEWFGIKYVPLGELTLIRKSARRINREKREAGRAAAITSPEPETPSKEFVFSKKEIAALNNLKTPEEWKIKDDGKMNMSLIDTQGREWNLTMSRPENRITLTRGADSYVFVKTNTSSISGLEQKAAGQEGEVKAEEERNRAIIKEIATASPFYMRTKTDETRFIAKVKQRIGKLGVKGWQVDSAVDAIKKRKAQSSAGKINFVNYSDITNQLVADGVIFIPEPPKQKTAEPETKPELTPEQNDVVVFVDIENDTQEKAVVAAEKKKRITPGEARKKGIAIQIDRLGITSKDPASVIAALEKIAAKPSEKHHGRIAKDLLSVLKDSGVQIQLVSGNDARMAKHDSSVNGWYDPATNTAYINLDGPHELGIEETILHELVHASGEKVIQNPQTDAQKRILADLEKQMLAARKNAIALGKAKMGVDVSDLKILIDMAAAQSDYGLFDILYGVSSLSEYHAHAMTSRSFQKFLTTYKEGGKRSLMGRFVNSITSLLSGKKTADGSDAEKAYATLLDLMRKGKGDVRLSNADVVASEQAVSFTDVVTEPIPKSETKKLDALPDDATIEDISQASPKLIEQSKALAIKFKDFASWSAAATKAFGSKAARFLETIWTGLKSISIAAIIGYTVTGVDPAFAPSIQEVGKLTQEDAVSVSYILPEAPPQQELVAVSISEPVQRPTEIAKPPTQIAKTTEDKIAESLSSFDSSVSHYVDFADTEFELEILNSVEPTAAMRAVAPLIGELEGNRLSGPNKTLEKVFEVGGIRASQDEVPWCAMFISHGLNKAGTPTRNVMASQFLSFGKKTSTPKTGDVVVFNKRNDDNTISPNTAGHVGFFIRESGDFVLVLNGNVGDGVAVTALPKRRVMQYRSAPAVRADVVQSRARGTDIEYMAAAESGDEIKARDALDQAAKEAGIYKGISARVSAWARDDVSEETMTARATDPETEERVEFEDVVTDFLSMSDDDATLEYVRWLQDLPNKNQMAEDVVSDIVWSAQIPPTVIRYANGEIIPLSQRFQQGPQSRARGRFDLVDAVRAASSGDASTPFQALNEAINANTELTRRIQAESERRSRAYARGKGAILEQIIRAGNTGRLPEEAIKPITDFVNSVSPQALADTRISLSAKPQNSTFDFVDSLVTIALNGMGSEPGEIDRTAIHEFWHGLSRFIPDDEIEKIRKDYVAAVKEYISENPWFVPFIGRTHLSEAQYDDLSRMLSKEEMDAIPWKNWETLEDGRRIRGLKWTKENYRLFRLDEWVAETMVDLVRRKQERPTTFLGKMARLLRDFIDTLKQALGNPYLKALDAMTVPGEAFDAQIERFGPIEDNPPVMYGGEGVGMNNQFSLGMYAGEQSLANMPEETRAFKRDSLEAARAMAVAGNTSEEIRAVTGWFPGKYDGKMRWEIPDAGAVIKRAKVDELGEADLPRMMKAVLSGVLTDDDFIKVASLEDVLNHEALFDAYPDARKIGFGFQSEFGGSFFPEKNLITADYNSVIRDTGTLLHEIQHWIQKKEGFSKWSNPDMFTGEYPPKAQRAAMEWLVTQGISPEDDYGYVNKNDYVKLAKSKGWDGPAFLMKPMTAYIHTAGEIEARDVDARKNLTVEQRAAIEPYSTDNIAAGDAIIIFSRARSIVSDTVTKFAPEFNVIDDKDGPAVFFDGRNVTVNPDALENLDEYEVKDLSERAVVAAKAAPKDPIAASIIQQTDGYSAYNFDSATRKEIRKSLAKAHAVATENGMAPLAMDLGAKLFEYGGATDAEVRKSMARGIPSDEEYLAAVEAGDNLKARSALDAAAKEAGIYKGISAKVSAWARDDVSEETMTAMATDPETEERVSFEDVVTDLSSMSDDGAALEYVRWLQDLPNKNQMAEDVISDIAWAARIPATITRDANSEIIPLSKRFPGAAIPQSRARGVDLVAYVPRNRSGPRLAVEKLFAGFRSRGMVTEDAYNAFRDFEAFKKETESFIAFIAKDFTNVTNKLFGDGADNWLNYRVFSRDASGNVTVSKTGFKTAKDADNFATTNRYKDYIVSTGEELMNKALGSNGPTLREDVRDRIDQLTKKGLDDIAKSIEAYKDEYLNYWNLVMMQPQPGMIDPDQIATLRERKEQWMKALQLRAAEQRQLVDDARKEAVRVALEDGANHIIAQQKFAKTYLPDELVYQIERTRDKIDEFSTRLTKIGWLMEGSELQMVIDGRMGVYVTRSYEAFETQDRAKYVAFLDEAYRALYNPEQEYNKLAMERIMPMVRHIKAGITDRRIQDLKKENEQRQLDEIMADLMADPRQVTQVDRIPGQPIEGTEYEQLLRAVARRELLLRRLKEKDDFIAKAVTSLGKSVFASNIGNARNRMRAIKKEAKRLYSERFAEQVEVANIMGAPNALRWTLMTEDEAHDIANVERSLSESPSNIAGSEIWTASISGRKHSTFHAAVSDDFRSNLDTITNSTASQTGFKGTGAGDWRSINDKILEYKENVPAFRRLFLGEINNPLMRVSETLTKQASLIAAGELYANLADIGTRQGWLVQKDLVATDTTKYAGWTSILTSSDNDQGYKDNPLKNLVADPVMVEAIRKLLSTNQPSNSAFKAISFAVGWVLFNLTAGSFKSIQRNLSSFIPFLLNTGLLGAIIDPRRWSVVTSNFVLASKMVEQSMASSAGVSSGKDISNPILKRLDKGVRIFLSGIAALRLSGLAVKGISTSAGFVFRTKQKPTNEQFQETYQRAVGLGVANDNVDKEAMSKMLNLEETLNRKPKDKKLGKLGKVLMLNEASEFGSYAFSLTKSTLKERSQLYGAPDDFTKIFAWLNEMDAQARIHAKDTAEYEKWRGKDGLFSDMPPEHVELAAEYTTDLVQSHSKVWSHITQFKKAGFGVLAAAFIAAKAEFYRNAFNSYRIAVKEMRSKNERERNAGIARFTSAITAHFVYGNAIGYGLKMILKAFADDDEVVEDSIEIRNAISALGPEYAKNKNATYVVYKNGTFDWVDLSFSTPFAFVWETINAGTRGVSEAQVEDNIVWEMTKEIVGENLGNFASPQIALDAFAVMRTGFDPVRGVKIWDSQTDNMGEKLMKSMGYFLKKVGSPGDVKSVSNIVNAARGIEENGRQYKLGTEVGSVFLGTSVRTFKIADIVEQKLAQGTNSLNNRITPLYNSVLTESNDVSMDDCESDTTEYYKTDVEVMTKMQKIWAAGNTLLADTPGGKKMLRAVIGGDKVKMESNRERALTTGKRHRVTLSDSMDRKVKGLSDKYDDPRHKVVKDTLKKLNEKP